jgi:hypothetical protein
MGHALRQPRPFLLAKCHDSLFHGDRDVLLGTVGGGHKAVQAGQFEKHTDQTDATGAKQRHHKMGGKDEPVEKGDAIRRLEKGDHRRRRINGVLTREPVLERRARDLYMLGKLALTRTDIVLQGMLHLRKFAGDLFSCPGLFYPWFLLILLA